MLDFEEKYIMYKNKYTKLKNQSSGSLDSIKCNDFIEKIYTNCRNNESMYYHGTTTIIYLILLLNSYMRGKSDIDFPRLLNINNEIIYSNDNNQINKRVIINDFNNYKDIIQFIEKDYPKIYELFLMDLNPIVKDHLLSVTRSNFKTNLEKGESFKIYFERKSQLPLSSTYIVFIKSLIKYFIPNTEISKDIINCCVNIVKQSLIDCILLLNDMKDMYGCSLYCVVLCITINNPDWVYIADPGGKISTNLLSDQSRIIINNKSVEYIKVVNIHSVILEHPNFEQIKSIMLKTSKDILSTLSDYIK